MLHDERAAYETWRQHPANAAAMEELQNIWAELEDARDQVPEAGKVAGPCPVTRRMTIIQSALVATIFGVALISVRTLPAFDGNDTWTALDWWSR